MKIFGILFFFVCYLGEGVVCAKNLNRDTLFILLARADNQEKKLDILLKGAQDALRTDVNAALQNSQELLLILAQVEDPKLLRNYYCGVAIVFLYCNIYDKALELFLASLKISEELQDQTYICANNNNIGGVHLMMENYDQALGYFQKVLKLSEPLVEAKDSVTLHSLPILYNNIGLTLGKLGNRLEGIPYIVKAIEMSDTSQHYLLGQYYANIGELYYLTGDKEKAAHYWERCVRVRRQMKDEKGLAEIDCLMAGLFFRDKDYKTSKILLDRSLAVAQRVNSKQLFQKLYALAVEYYKVENNLPAVIENMEKLYQVKNDLVNEKVLSRITSLKLEYDFDKRLVEQNNEMQKTKMRHRLTLVIAGMLMVVLAMLYLLLRYRMREIHSQKRVLEKDLELRNKEMTTSAMVLMKNTDLIQEIIRRLVKLRPNLKSENDSVIKEIIRELQLLSQNDAWDEFEARFNRVHIDFYKNLKERCPDLTPTELKVCAFLRLNMSSKEISSLIGVESKSVDIMRARIRKRLNINNTNTNLVTFLTDF